MYQHPKRRLRRAARVARSILHEARNADRLSSLPQSERKTRVDILWDMVRWYLAHGEHCGNYFQYGLDSPDSVPDAYVSSRELLRYRAKPVRGDDAGSWDAAHVVILRDKVLFNKVMEYHGIAVPAIFGQISEGRVSDRFCRPVESVDALVKAGSAALVKERYGEQAGKLSGGPDDSFFLLGSPGSTIPGVDGDALSAGDRKYLQAGDWIVQELIHQDEAMAMFNPSSVNTLRIFTFASGDEILAPAARLKVGGKGRLVDNVQWGGFYCEIDAETGSLTGNVKYTKGTDETSIRSLNELLSSGPRIPRFFAAVDLARAAHRVVEYVPSIGWDVAITDSGPVVIEGNDNWGLLTLQLFGGARDLLHQIDPLAFPVSTGND